jgi:AcrR family transcriptional regulator
MFRKQVKRTVAIGRDDMRPRTDRRVGKTRKALKEALTDLILEQGYEAVTVQDVIDRADVGRSTFYAHFADRDALLMAIVADLGMPGLDPRSWKPDDPAFGWTLALFRHFGSSKRLFKAVAGGQTGSLARRETTRRLEELASAELSRLNATRKLDAFNLQTIVRFLVGTFIGFMDWWLREENDYLTAEQVDHAFRTLVLPGVGNVLELELELPTSL